MNVSAAGLVADHDERPRSGTKARRLAGEDYWEVEVAVRGPVFPTIS
jgi:hypothetical protein